MSLPETFSNLVISSAHAAESPAPAPAAAPQRGVGDLFGGLPFIILMFVLLYFMLIRPQQKRAKEHREMVTKLAKGDEVVTSGGVLGKVTDLSDNYVTVEVADGVAVKLQRHAVTQVLPKGTIKGA